MKNKLYSVILLAIGAGSAWVTGDATCSVILAIIAIPLFFVKEDMTN